MVMLALQRLQSLGGDTFPPDDEWKSTALPSNCVDGTATGANEDANRCVLRTTCDTAITEPFLRVALTTPATALTTIKVLHTIDDTRHKLRCFAAFVCVQCLINCGQ